VVVRVDYNVALTKDSPPKVKEDRRIRDSLATIRFLLKHKAKVVLLAHLGRPDGKRVAKYSLEPVAAHLEKLLKQDVLFLPETTGKLVRDGIEAAKPGSVIMVENLRFHNEETDNDSEFAKKLADLGDVYVNEAFSASHRSHASIVGIPKHLPAYAGFSLEREATQLASLMDKPRKPFVVILGGAKISDKVGALTHLAKLADIVLIGGAIANNFLKAEGFEIYRSFVEEATKVKDGSLQDYTKVAADLIYQHKTEHILIDGYIPLPKIIYPIDAIAAPSLETTHDSQVDIVDLSHGMADTDENKKLLYLDIGPKTRKLYQEIIDGAGTIFWNGPMGVWENKLFAAGTRTVAKAIIDSSARTVLGGGDTIAAAHHFHYEYKFDYVSAAGGAALEFLSGKTLPGLKPLMQR
jgi:3-phosphoglycerate kinase